MTSDQGGAKIRINCRDDDAIKGSNEALVSFRL